MKIRIEELLNAIKALDEADRLLYGTVGENFPELTTRVRVKAGFDAKMAALSLRIAIGEHQVEIQTPTKIEELSI